MDACLALARTSKHIRSLAHEFVLERVRLHSVEQAAVFLVSLESDARRGEKVKDLRLPRVVIKPFDEEDLV